MTTSGARGWTSSPTSASFSVTMPATGAARVASAMAFCQVAICASAAATLARAPSMSSRREPARSFARYSRAARTRERQLGVGCVEPGDDLAGNDPVSFGHAQLEQPAADLGRDLHIGRLDLPCRAHTIGGRFDAASQEGGARQSGERYLRGL